MPFHSSNRCLPHQRIEPPKSPLREYLQSTHGAIDALNESWQTQYRNWTDWLQSTHFPDRVQSKADATAFMTLSAERYYRTVAAIVADTLPGVLYLCSRFNGTFSDSGTRGSRTLRRPQLQPVLAVG